MDIAVAVLGRGDSLGLVGDRDRALTLRIGAVLVLLAMIGVACVGVGRPVRAERRVVDRVSTGAAVSDIAWARAPVALRAAVAERLGAAREEFAITRTSGGLIATGGGLRAAFGRDGLSVQTGSGAATVRLLAAGSRAAQEPVSPAVPAADGGRVVYRRGRLVEWYAGGAGGLEQGFTIARPGSGVPAAFVLRVGFGRLVPRWRGGVIVLERAGASTPVLRYGGLSVVDARGRRLAARMRVVGSSVLLEVRTAGARFPVRVDPFIQQGSKLTDGSLSQNALAGVAVALSADGSTAVVGVPGDDSNLGSVLVFVRSGSGWVEQGPKLSPSDAEGSVVAFGVSLALSADGNTVAIGGPVDNDGPGAVWIFTR
jgi:hypothetical protein